MQPTGHLRGDAVRVGGDARQRFHDSGGYGRPLGGDEIALSRGEAAHLLFRGDLDAVDGAGFRTFLAAQSAGFTARFLVYADLRDRGFYLAPDRQPWWSDPGDGDFVVFPRGKGPDDGVVKHRVRVVDERATLPEAELDDVVLAVVDEESELTYLELSRPSISGSSLHDIPDGVAGDLLADRVLVTDPPTALHERAFYGQRMDDGSPHLQLSLVEGAYLAGLGVLDVDGGQGELAARGRAVEGDRFDRRLRAYSALRTAGVVPKTGFKFGADFRTYANVESVDDLGHSELLVRVLPPESVFSPIDLALDVRLAHGVRKRMVYALTGADAGIEWLSVARLTP